MGLITENKIDRYAYFMEKARRARLIVAEVFDAMNKGEVSQIQCREILATYERARVPTWQRLITSS